MPKSCPLADVVTRVADLIHRPNALDIFRKQIRQAADERLEVQALGKQRTENRRSHALEHGTVVEGKDHPPRPEKNLVHWIETVHGTTKRPKRMDEGQLFKTLQQQGFPDEPPKEGRAKDDVISYEYSFEVWLPEELGPEYDPATNDPLPVPQRPVSLAEKYAALAAIYDAYSRGSEKIAPWGTDVRGEKPVPENGDGASKPAMWYFLLVHGASESEDDLKSTASSLGLWLKNVTEDLDDKLGQGHREGMQREVGDVQGHESLKTSRGEDSEEPATYLTSWLEILDALKMKNNEDDKRKVRTLNNAYRGPIIIGGQGKSPFADKTELLEWWNGLAEKAQADADRRRDEQATVADRHNYGKQCEVVPGISGEVKNRRKDHRP